MATPDYFCKIRTPKIFRIRGGADFGPNRNHSFHREMDRSLSHLLSTYAMKRREKNKNQFWISEQSTYIMSVFSKEIYIIAISNTCADSKYPLELYGGSCKMKSIIFYSNIAEVDCQRSYTDSRDQTFYNCNFCRSKQVQAFTFSSITILIVLSK